MKINTQRGLAIKEVTEALVTAYQADALTATLNREEPPFKEGDPTSPGWHLFIFARS